MKKVENVEFESVTEWNAEVRKQIESGLDNFFSFAKDRHAQIEQLYEKPMVKIRERGDMARIEINLVVKG